MKSSMALAVSVLSLTAFIAAAGPAFAQSSVTAADRAFLMKASQANHGEVASGKLAQQKGVSADTRSLGKRFVDNHSDNQMKLGMVAKKLNVMLPMHPAAEDVMVMAKLKSMSGSSFDSAFLAVEQKDHMKNIAAFKKEAAMSKNPMIVAYAKASIPVLEEHLNVATDDAAKMHRMGAMGGAGMSNSSNSNSSMNSGMGAAGTNDGMHAPNSGGQPGTPASNGAGSGLGSVPQSNSTMTKTPVSGGQPGTPASTGAGGTGANAAGASSGTATGATGNGAGPNGPTGGGAGSVPQPGTPPQR
jgi:predicted outer membrane protein